MIIKDYAKMNGEYDTKIKFINREQLDCIYEGKVSNNKLNDENASIRVIRHDTNKDVEILAFEGQISNNVKDGTGKYVWDKENDEYYQGTFVNNQLHTTNVVFNDQKDYRYHGAIKVNGELRKVIFDKGHLIRYMPI